LKPKAIIVIGFFVSLSIEILQAILGFIIGYNYRAFDVNDLILNTVGTIIGLIIFKALFKFLNNNNLLLDKEQKVTV
jgi:glycopeptide antibiotics resistance protein